MFSNLSLRGGYDTDRRCLAGTLAVNGGDVKLRADINNPKFVTAPSVSSASLSLEKPGSFLVDYHVPNKGFRFQFMNAVRVWEKQLYLTYTHAMAENRTALDGRLVLDLAQKVSANYAFGSGDCKVKYTYVHDGVQIFEPSFDFGDNSWGIAVSQKMKNDEVIRASYESSSKVLGLEWLVDSKSNSNGVIKIKASFDLAKELCMPKLSAESSWSFDL